MRTFVEGEAFSIAAYSSTNTILLAWNCDSSTTLSGVVGFAVERSDADGKHRFFLSGGSKQFRGESTKESEEHEDAKEPPSASSSSGATRTTTEQYPIQGFQWADYTVKPDSEYKYTVYAMTGEPVALTRSKSFDVKIKTEGGSDAIHTIYFNRGVAGSQGYAKLFGNKKPEEVADRKAYQWLSNGLEEAMLSFVSQAKDNSYQLRVAAYEFNYEPFLLALKAVHERAVDVKVVVDWKVAKDGSFKVVKDGIDHVAESDAAIVKTSFPRSLLIERRAGTSFISHNKFIVLMKNGEPQSVWTGSTNFTEGGIFGQSNNGHVCRDANIARQYLEYWTRLSSDPTPAALRAENDRASPLPTSLAPRQSLTLFSPRSSDAPLSLYTELLDSAAESVMFTAAFGVNELFANNLEKPSATLVRYVLLEKDDKRTRALKTVDGTRLAIGEVLSEKAAERLNVLPEQLSGLNDHVSFIHTKYLIVDAFTDDPIVVCGSANFSTASNTNNDENMMVIRGDTRVADQFATNFLRMFRHHEYRNRANSNKLGERGAGLARDDSWVKEGEYFVDGSIAARERALFCKRKSSSTTASLAAKRGTIDLSAERIARHKPVPGDDEAPSDATPAAKPRMAKGARLVIKHDDTHVRLLFGYSATLVEQLKATIDAQHRAWIGDAKYWVVDVRSPTLKKFLDDK